MKRMTSRLLIGCLLSAVAVFGQNDSSKERQWREEVKEKLRLANQPMDFYGQVLDQTDQPVKGLKIVIKALTLIDPTGKSEDWDQDEKEYELISGSDGRFEFHGKKGTGIEVELQRKEGYHYSIYTRKSFDFDPTDDPTGRYPLHKPDPQQPVIFRAWKARGGETVVRWERGIKSIPQDGTPVGVDLLALEFRPAGSVKVDFRIALNAEIPPKARPSDKFPWSVRIEAIDGGVVITDDEFMYLAPETGYRPVADFIFDPADPISWEKGRQPIKFYLRSQGGKYCARVVLDVGPRVDRPTAGLVVESVINLTGSRNLEEGKVLPYLSNTR